MKINPLIFRTYDIGGIYKKDIDEDVFRKIGLVLGRKNKKIFCS
jgi:phosphomannomutase